MESYRNRARPKNAASFFAVIGVFLLTVSLFIGVFFWYGRAYAPLSLEKEYYFLVKDCEDATASAVAGQVYLRGGAGYLLETDGKSAVVLACYFHLSDAERVRSSMSEKDVETRILTLKTKDFSLDGGAAGKKNAVCSNVETAETCARILYNAANGLERAEMTQEEARAAVRGAVGSLKGLRIGNGDSFELWNAKLASCERRGTEIAEGILFSKDLRYLQVEICLAIVNADEYFG